MDLIEIGPGDEDAQEDDGDDQAKPESFTAEQ